MSNRVLVVEDDAGLREALIDTLQLSNIECVEASCAEQAVLLLKQETFSLVVSDVQMGAMSGLDLLKTIKLNYPELPVLMMTAYATIDDAVEAMRLGAIDYMAKPFAPEVLLNMVGRYLPEKEKETDGPIVADPKSIKLLELAAKVAKSDASVMVLGPSGSGKEVLARYIHDKSDRADEPLSQLTALQSQKICSKRPCLVTKRGHLQVPFRRVLENLSKHKRERFCLMRSQRWIWDYKQNYFACYKSAR